MADLFTQMDDFLQNEQFSEDCLDLMGVMGACTAHCVNACTNLDAIIFDGQLPKASLLQQWVAMRDELLHILQQELAGEATFELPFELTDLIEDSDMQAFCCGFMEVVFATEKQWFAKDDQRVAVLLFPLEVGSGLFAQEPEFKKFETDAALLWSTIQDMPEVLTDLYLIFNSGDKS